MEAGQIKDFRILTVFSKPFGIETGGHPIKETKGKLYLPPDYRFSGKAFRVRQTDAGKVYEQLNADPVDGSLEFVIHNNEPDDSLLIIGRVSKKQVR